MQHKQPLHSSSLTNWRSRVGAEKLLSLLEETVAAAARGKLDTKRELAQVSVETIDREKTSRIPLTQSYQQTGCRTNYQSRHMRSPGYNRFLFSNRQR